MLLSVVDFSVTMIRQKVYPTDFESLVILLRDFSVSMIVSVLNVGRSDSSLCRETLRIKSPIK